MLTDFDPVRALVILCGFYSILQRSNAAIMCGIREPASPLQPRVTPMLKGKSALVTGSTSGIGLAIAHALAKQGANITINGFGEKGAIEKERAGIEKEFGVKAIYSGADMTKPAEIADMIKATETTFGSVDVLINNAGIQFTAKVEDFPIEKWDAVIATNLSA